jgi:hypothetical protein
MADKKDTDFHGSGFGFRRPDIEKIQCKDCIFREKDRLNGAIKGATLSVCDCYDGKPSEILWKNEECIYYESEDEPEDDSEE